MAGQYPNASFIILNLWINHATHVILVIQAVDREEVNTIVLSPLLLAVV